MIDTRLGRLLALLAAVIAFAVYWVTLAHTITWLHNGADSGDLVTAAYVYGIPHPPGYPLYTLVAFFFARAPLFEPAHNVAIFSALMASAAVYVLARAGAALGKTFEVWAMTTSQETSKVEMGSKVGSVFVGPIAALAFAFALLTWSQATIPEVYALNLFFVALILWAVVTESRHRMNVAALAFGFGMAHHLSILLLLPGALVALRPTRRDWRAVLLVLAPLILYLYLPFAALPNPPVKWGDPVTPAGFVWLVTAQLYRPYLFAVDPADVLSRFAFAARTLVDQFTIVGLALAVWGLVQMGLRQRRLFVATMLMFVPVVVYSIVYASRDSFLYLLPAFAIVLLWIVYGVQDVLGWAGDDRVLRVAAVVLFALLPGFNLVTNYAAMDISQDRAAFDYGRQSFEGLTPDAVLFADGDEAVFAVWYYRHVILAQSSRSVMVSQGLLFYDWYYDSLRRIMSEVTFQEPEAVPDSHARAREIIRVAFAEGRAVCFTDSSPLLPEFEYEERGVLKCVIAERASAGK